MKLRPIIMLKVCQSQRAFTLLDMLVSMTVLGGLLVMTLQLFSSAQMLTRMGTKRMDVDEQARAVFDRMAIDFAQMIKREDVDYYLKDAGNTQHGNDQLAFYSQVPGYYPSNGSQSPISLVAYRINSGAKTGNPYFNQLERFGCGLVWSGVPAADTTEPPMVFLPLTISATWPNATSAALPDSRYYELVGPQIFRMEYYYVIKGQVLENGATTSPQLSDVPWDARILGHYSSNGLRDVSAIVVVIAVIDTKSRALVTEDQLSILAGTMPDFLRTLNQGELETMWQSAIDDPCNGIPRDAVFSVRIYRRCFPISTP